jgi:hypothetical protein
MALAFYFAPTSVMTARQYDECTRRLTQAGAGSPADRLYHACFGSPDSVAVFDVWTSLAAFETFGQTLMPILQDLGVELGHPSVMPVHNVIVPPAARPRGVSKKAAAKRTVAKKSAARRAAPTGRAGARQASRRAVPKAAARKRVAPKKGKPGRRAGRKR